MVWEEGRGDTCTIDTRSPHLWNRDRYGDGDGDVDEEITGTWGMVYDVVIPKTSRGLILYGRVWVGWV